MSNKDTISCAVCQDLLPLIKDGVANEESTAAVRQHIADCKACSDAMEQPLPDEMPTLQKTMRQAKKWLNSIYAFLMFFGIYFGLSLTDGKDFVQNTLIMPAVGILGYVLFRKHAFYTVPLLLYGTHLVIWGLELFSNTASESFRHITLYSCVYALFAILGSVAACFLHFGFRKEQGKFDGIKATMHRVLKLVCGIGGILMLGVLLFVSNAFNGNLISYFLVKHSASNTLAEKYSDMGYQIDDVAYDFKDNCYLAHLTVPQLQDSHFSIAYDFLGKTQWDSYESAVLNGQNTFARLDNAYRTMCRNVWNSSQFPYKQRIAIGISNLKSILGEVELKPEGIYDLNALAAEYGELTIYFDDDEVSEARAAQRLLEMKEWLDKGGVTFHKIYFVLQSPWKSEDASLQSVEHYEDREEIVLKDFLAKDIYAEGLEERVAENAKRTAAEFAEMDAKNPH